MELQTQPPLADNAPASGTKDALRVLLIVESAAGGTGRHVLDLAEGLIASGCEVHLVWSSNRVDKLFLSRLEKIRDLHHFSLPLRTAPHPADMAALWRIRRYMRRNGPFDIVHGHSSKGGALARLAALGTRARAVYTLHGLIMMDPGLGRLKKLVYTTIELMLALRTSRIIAVSPEEARAAVRLGLGRSRVALIPNGVGPAELTPRDAARAEMGVRDGDVVIGFIGRLVEQKDPRVLLEGFAKATRANPQTRLALVGAGPLERDMRAWADELGIADRIVWLGERDARGVMAGFDLFAISSRKEGLPYVVLESMAAGLPIVATSSAGVEILVQDGVNGYVVPPGDGEAFGDALVRLVTDGQRLADFGEASLRRAARFTIETMVERTRRLYEACRDDLPASVGADDDFELDELLVHSG